MLFNLGSYNCSSRHNNLIAFSFEVALLLRVLRSAGATDSDALEVALSLGPQRLRMHKFHAEDRLMQCDLQASHTCRLQMLHAPSAPTCISALASVHCQVAHQKKVCLRVPHERLSQAPCCTTCISPSSRGAHSLKPQQVA